nr:hypothetical protein [Rhodococcus tukisamuensis]
MSGVDLSRADLSSADLTVRTSLRRI